jgi:acyl-[acyl-carrier-protein]-phospholipid O-acyltransferase/long-chain-fatty-acid--[acyl-carrier-protein] ligase
MIGIVLPATVAGAIVNLAVMMAGKIPVNLNWTASREATESAIRRCRIKTVLTSKVFVKRAKIGDLPGQVMLEDLARRISGGTRFFWWLVCNAVPRAVLVPLIVDRRARRGIDEVCTVIFSSGSTGEPKGVMLTHANVLSNIFGLADLFRVERADRILGVLPFFHSFGFTTTLCLPFMAGAGVAYHANPLEAKGVAEAARKYRTTVLLATPTFLQLYSRSVSVGDFRTLRHVIVGAERLPHRISEAFRAKFGAEPREGYGCTELSPIVSLNLPDFSSGGIEQVGTKRGTIGLPLPGVLVRIVDPETFEPRKVEEEGLILVRGPNVMAGYLDDEERTRKVMRDDWYVTGDIGRIDEDGFITLTDRLSRFSKIGGEMVPHVKVEEAIQEETGREERCCVVTSVTGGPKGERIAVIHTDLGRSPTKLVGALRKKGLPNLWVPKADAFIEVDEIPLLGSGKVNLGEIRKLAKEALSG